MLQVSDIPNSIMSTVICITLAVTPYLAYTQLQKHQKKLQEEATIQKYGSLYENIETSSKKNIFYVSLYFIRRLVFSMTAVLITSSSFVQVIVTIVFSMSLLSMQVSSRLFKTRIVAFFEFYNELTILLVLTCLLPITADYFSAENV